MKLSRISTIIGIVVTTALGFAACDKDDTCEPRLGGIPLNDSKCQQRAAQAKDGQTPSSMADVTIGRGSLQQDMQCQGCGESHAAHNISNFHARIRVQTDRRDLDHMNRWPDHTSFDNYSVPPRGSTFLGCSGGRKSNPGVCNLAFYRKIVHIQRAERMKVDGTRVDFANSGHLILIQNKDSCREHCTKKNEYCANVSSLAASYSRGALLIWQKINGKTSISKQDLAQWFDVSQDPCNRGDIEVSSDTISNKGLECTMEVDGAVAGLSSVKVSVSVPKVVSGRLSHMAALGFAVEFHDKANAMTLEFSDRDLNLAWGGNVNWLEANQENAIIETDNGCVLWKFGTN